MHCISIFCKMISVRLIHYAPLSERLAPSIQLWTSLGYDISVISVADGNNLQVVDSFNNLVASELWLNRITSLLPILLENANIKPLPPNFNLCDLPGWLAPRPLIAGEISVLIKHFLAISSIAQGDEQYGIIAEDDLVMLPDSLINFDKCINEFIACEGDYLDIAGGANLGIQKFHHMALSNVGRLSVFRTRTNACYVLSKVFAKFLADNFYPFCFPIDWHLQWIFSTITHPSYSCYWSLEPPLGHGSESGFVKSWRA